MWPIKDGFISLLTPNSQLLYFIPFTLPPFLPKTNIKERHITQQQNIDG
jgi:hypothetical protein